MKILFAAAFLLVFSFVVRFLGCPLPRTHVSSGIAHRNSTAWSRTELMTLVLLGAFLKLSMRLRLV